MSSNPTNADALLAWRTHTVQLYLSTTSPRPWSPVMNTYSTPTTYPRPQPSTLQTSIRLAFQETYRIEITDQEFMECNDAALEAWDEGEIDEGRSEGGPCNTEYAKWLIGERLREKRERDEEGSEGSEGSGWDWKDEQPRGPFDERGSVLPLGGFVTFRSRS